MFVLKSATQSLQKQVKKSINFRRKRLLHWEHDYCSLDVWPQYSRTWWTLHYIRGKTNSSQLAGSIILRYSIYVSFGEYLQSNKFHLQSCLGCFKSIVVYQVYILHTVSKFIQKLFHYNRDIINFFVNCRLECGDNRICANFDYTQVRLRILTCEFLIFWINLHNGYNLWINSDRTLYSVIKYNSWEKK